MNGKCRKTLEQILERPSRSDVRWADVEHLLGAEIEEGRGSRVRFAPNGVRAIFHRPHPQRIAGKAMVDDVRRFLDEAGIPK